MREAPSIGQLVPRDAARDAIHIAVAPVKANECLAPGTHVGLIGDDLVSDQAPVKVGIVDPYLAQKVEKGERFWLFVYPNTITSLRHNWTHPAFAALQYYTPDKSRRWIAVFAEQISQTYDSLMEAADHWVRDQHGTVDNDEGYKGFEDWFPTFWRHYEIVRGVTVSDHSETIFSCSC